MLILLNFWKVEQRELQKEIPLKLHDRRSSCPFQQLHQVDLQQFHQVYLQQLSLPAASPSWPAAASPSWPAAASPSLPAKADPAASPSIPAAASLDLQQLLKVDLQQLYLTCSSFTWLAAASQRWPAAASPSWPAAASLDLEQLTRYRSHLAPTSVQNCNNSNLPRLHRIFYVASVFNNCHSTFILFYIPSLSLHMYCQFSG